MTDANAERLTTEALLDIEPKTFKEAILHGLVSRGMFANQAYDVFERYAASKEAESMAHRWNDAMEGYPPVMLAVLRTCVDVTALEYIDEVCPKAWFRPMFAARAEESKTNP